MKNIGYLVLLIILNSCIKEQSETVIKTFLENKTSKEIQLTFYDKNQEKDIIKLKSNDKILNSIFFVNERILKKGSTPTIIETLGPNLEFKYSSKFKIDSLLVVFGSNKAKVHLAYQIISNNKYSLKTTDSRNIFSFDSYKINKSKSNVTEATYTFIEQDCINAETKK